MTNQLTSDDDGTIEVKARAEFPWMLMIFGGIFTCLGILWTMPFAPGQNIPLGIVIVVFSISAILAGRYWLRNLPVVMRLSSKGLELPGRAITYLWSDIEQVVVKNLHVKGPVSFLCLRLKPESKKRYAIKDDGFIARTVKAVWGDFDLSLSDSDLSIHPELLMAEIEKRMASAQLDNTPAGWPGK